MTETWMPLYRRALGRDRFLARWCARCGHEATAWADGEYGVVLRCPHCLRERVRALREEQGTLPGAVDYLETMADRDLERQSVSYRADLTLDFDVFTRCDRCDRVLHRDDARYWLPPGASSSPPYCQPCRAELAGEAGEDRPDAGREEEAGGG